jgi:DNA-directed RNA polymerase beta subunit
MNKSENVYAFQRMQNPNNPKKVGFICDAKTREDAICGLVKLVAVHCTITNENPANLITNVETA